MGMYTGLRFKGVVKKEFRRNFESIALGGEWENSSDEKLREFGGYSRSGFIPCGSLAYMPDIWEDESGKATEGFERTYNKETGYWTFQCSLKNYEDTIEEFFKLLPYFIEEVEHCEVFFESADYSNKYVLYENTMKFIGGFRCYEDIFYPVNCGKYVDGRI